MSELTQSRLQEVLRYEPESGLFYTPKGVKALPSGRFQARIRVNHELIHLGTFETAEQAQQAYLQAARTHYGQFARAS